jgi:hypothetical protein
MRGNLMTRDNFELLLGWLQIDRLRCELPFQSENHGNQHQGNNN